MIRLLSDFELPRNCDHSSVHLELLASIAMSKAAAEGQLLLDKGDFCMLSIDTADP